jgi:hypothetical protein
LGRTTRRLNLVDMDFLINLYTVQNEYIRTQ